MTYLLLTVFSLTLAVFVNSMNVYLQRQRHIYDKFDNGQLMHSLVIAPFWLVFVFLLSRLNQAYVIEIPEYPVFGYLIIVIAVALFVVSIRQIGSGALVNANFFRKDKTKLINRGVYKYLKNPIYDSYFLLFIGMGFVFSNSAFFIIAAISFLGLNIIESKVERIE